ncbi:AAA family ATPase [Paenibacillus hunanensis]|uniref:AAA family ATPase n=1 Tax=Paenibacillus hunanensis TaxID=539262 RepID=UPI0020264A50|nr:AAA family ATPase [Paenibacillus hunanensis]MCL9663025.1 AAA family ATPase [Paenibacillus hunanensis]
MFIKKLRVDKFKKLKNFELEFPESKIIDLEKDKEMKLSIIIGENGTAKTTIFELIINSFLLIENFKNTCEYEVDYKLNEIDYTKTSYNDCSKYPSNIVISSYTPIDKLDIKKESEGSQKVFLQKTNMNNQSIKRLSTRILKKFASNKFEEVYSILKYVGYEKRELYFEISNYQLKSDIILDKVANGLRRMEYEEYKLPYLDVDIKEKIYCYIRIIDGLSSRIGARKRANYFHNKIKRIFSENLNYKRNIQNLNFKEKHFILEALFIVEKFSLVFKNIKDHESSYKNGKSKLLSIANMYFYPGGNQQLLLDLEFLDLFSVNLFNDVWFENNFNNDLFPISMFSSGELSMFMRFFDLHEHVQDNSIVLIDEPETHLHPKWIRGYIKTLIDLLGDRKCHVIIATHSPLIVSDVTKSCIIGLKKDRNSIKQVEINDKTLGLNYEEILSDIFNIEDPKGKMINEYVDVVEQLLKIGEIDKALRIYSEIADSETKYKLFIEMKEFIDKKGNRDV